MKLFITLSLFMVPLLACKPSTSSNTKSEATPPSIENPPSTDPSSPGASEMLRDTSDTEREKTVDNATHTEQAPPVKAKPKICDPNFTKLSSPKRNHHIYYVSNFTSGEFKCWIELEEQGAKICNGAPCVVYFVDNPRVKVESGIQDYMSAEALISSGIGRYEYNGKTWEIKGAGIWKRAGKSYTYYNTDNY